MSRKTEKVVCWASGRDFIFANLAGKSFSATGDHNNYFRIPCQATYGSFDTFWVLAPYEMYSRMYSS